MIGWERRVLLRRYRSSSALCWGALCAKGGPQSGCGYRTTWRVASRPDSPGMNRLPRLASEGGCRRFQCHACRRQQACVARRVFGGARSRGVSAGDSEDSPRRFAGLGARRVREVAPRPTFADQTFPRLALGAGVRDASLAGPSATNGCPPLSGVLRSVHPYPYLHLPNGSPLHGCWLTSDRLEHTRGLRSKG